MQQSSEIIGFLAPYRQTHSVYLIGPLCQQLPDLTDKAPHIFVDGGSKHKANCLHPAISVGDGDSSLNNLDIVLPEDKDISDLGYVLNHLQGCSDIYLNGFIGARRDHEYFNIGEVYRFIDTQAHCHARFDEQFSILSAGHWQCHINGTFSVGTIHHNRVSIQGQCKFPLHDHPPLNALSSVGLSNQGFGQIDITCDKPILLFYQDASFSMITSE